MPPNKLDDCIVWNDNTVFDLKQSAIRAQAVYFLHSTMPSVTCLRMMSALSAALLIFSFQFSLLFFHIGRQAALRRIGFNSQYQTLDVAENLGRYLSCTERTATGNDFELILTVKMETRHPIEGSFGSEFPAICYHCVGLLVARRSEVARRWNFVSNFCVR